MLKSGIVRLRCGEDVNGSNGKDGQQMKMMIIPKTNTRKSIGLSGRYNMSVSVGRWSGRMREDMIFVSFGICLANIYRADFQVCKSIGFIGVGPMRFYWIWDLEA